MPCGYNVEPNYNMERGWAEILANNRSELEEFKYRVQYRLALFDSYHVLLADDAGAPS
jgi:hypothetical protein